MLFLNHLIQKMQKFTAVALLNIQLALGA